MCNKYNVYFSFIVPRGGPTLTVQKAPGRERDSGNVKGKYLNVIRMLLFTMCLLNIYIIFSGNIIFQNKALCDILYI